MSNGHLTLAGRTGQGSLLKSEILPLCDSSVSLRQTCLAYQASLEEHSKHLMPIYLQSALASYFDDLSKPDRLEMDATLSAGILLCSVSVSLLEPQNLSPTLIHG